MTPDFAKAIDPIFIHALDVLDQIESGQSPNPQDECHRVSALLERAEAKLGRSEQWQLAKYALATWIDEVLLDAPWAGHDWWENNPLEIKFFGTRDRATEFYAQANSAAKLPQRDALEVFYLGVILGFRGIYRDPNDAAMQADSLELPHTIEQWTKQAAVAIRLGQGRPAIGEVAMAADGAPPLGSKSLLVWTMFASVLLSSIAAVFIIFEVLK